METEKNAAAVTSELTVTGMTCGNCARHVTEAIQSVPGVSGASVRLEAGGATVLWPSRANPDAAVKAIQEAGYGAAEISRESPSGARNSWSPLSGWRFNVVVGLGCTLPLMAGEWIFHWGTRMWFHWAALLLALPVQVLCGARFYEG